MKQQELFKVRAIIIVSILLPLCFAFLIDNKAILVFADILVWGWCIVALKIKTNMK